MFPALLPGSAPAATPYDGRWSVVIVTQQGDCDRAYRYEVAIVNGRVSYAGEGGFDLNGRVGKGGAVRVSIARGSARADGVGRLGRDSGSGRWSGVSQTGQCAGVGQAERRGA
jgi:hypothetical protein